MLAQHPVDVMLLATDLERAKDFYGDTIGLGVILESDQFVTFACGGDSRLVVTKSSTGPSEEATKASWRVDDLAAEVSELRARGVELEDVAGLDMVDGIADIGFALAAWFADPDRNSIGLLQLKDTV
jgi:catechol-2,3-dioxygenase